MPKTRFVFAAAALVAAVLAPAAHADGQASPGVYQGWNGLVDKARGARFVALPADHGRWTVLARIKLRGGSVTRYGSIRGSYGIPGVTFRGDVGGLSPDGRVLVVAATPTGGSILRPVSRLAVVDARTLKTRARITLTGDLSFDALSPDGRTLYLIQHTSTRTSSVTGSAPTTSSNGGCSLTRSSIAPNRTCAAIRSRASPVREARGSTRCTRVTHRSSMRSTPCTAAPSASTCPGTAARTSFGSHTLPYATAAAGSPS